MTPTFPCQLKQSVGVRDNRSPPTTTITTTGPSPEGAALKAMGRSWRRRMGEKSQTSNFGWQPDAPHLHTLMHDSSAPLYQSAKRYIYFANANL